MKLLLKEGKFVSINGREELRFEPSGIDTEMFFTESVDKITHVLTAYDFKKFRDSEIYYMFCLLKESISPEEIEMEIDKLLKDDDSDVINIEYSTICMPDETEGNTIFWDVLNHIIIIKGSDNLKRLLIELEKSRLLDIRPFLNQEGSTQMSELLLSPISMKASNL